MLAFFADGVCTDLLKSKGVCPSHRAIGKESAGTARYVPACMYLRATFCALAPEPTANETALNGAGSKVSLGLEKPDGRNVVAELSRAFTSKERATAVSAAQLQVNKES